MGYLIDLVLHLDVHLQEIIARFGDWTYLILFAIVFLETGIVFTPFLPGDSLLFAAGTFAALGSLSLPGVLLILALAAVLGDSSNYAIGRYLGLKLFERYPRWLKKEHLDKTHRFYEKYGAKTLVIARFVPIVRTFAPFVAGVGSMSYRKFFMYNVVGGLLWVLLLVPAGYFFGTMPFVRQNFSLVILAIIVISILPAVVEVLAHRREAEREAAGGATAP